MSKYAGKLGELHIAYTRAISRWPVDALRPTHSYKAVLKQQMGRKFDKLSAIHGPQLNEELGRIEREIAALNNLLANKHKAQNKVSEAITDPASHRGYYTKLLESIARATTSKDKGMLRVD